MGNDTKVTTIAGAGALSIVLITIFGPMIEEFRGAPLPMEFGSAFATVLAMVFGYFLPQSVFKRERRKSDQKPLPPAGGS